MNVFFFVVECLIWVIKLFNNVGRYEIYLLSLWIYSIEGILTYMLRLEEFLYRGVMAYSVKNDV